MKMSSIIKITNVLNYIIVKFIHIWKRDITDNRNNNDCDSVVTILNVIDVTTTPQIIAHIHTTCEHADMHKNAHIHNSLTRTHT